MYCVSILISCLGLSSWSSCATTYWPCGSFQPPTCHEGKSSSQSNVSLPSNYIPPSQHDPSILPKNVLAPPHQNNASQSQVYPSLNVFGPSSTGVPLVVPAPTKSNQPVTSSPLNAPLIAPASLSLNDSRAVSQFPFTSAAVPVTVNPNTTATSPSITNSREEATQIFDKSTHASNISVKETLESKINVAASPSMPGTPRNAVLSEISIGRQGDGSSGNKPKSSSKSLTDDPKLLPYDSWASTPATKTMSTNRLLFVFR